MLGILSKTLLFPYFIILKLRNLFYDKGLFKSEKFSIPVLCIGNITVGGTGKTPHTEMVIRELQGKIKIAVLSRGYKRKSKGFRIVNIDDSHLLTGDEPLQIKQKFPSVIVAVCKKRSEGIKELLKIDPTLQLIILDDAFQHRSVRPHRSLLLVNSNRSIKGDNLLPIGRLRDLPTEIKRADDIIITKSNVTVENEGIVDSERTMERICSKEQEWRKELKLKEWQKLYFSTIYYGAPTALFPEADHRYIYSKSAVCFSGIANDSEFRNHLVGKYKIISSIKFSDHKNFTRSNMRQIEKISRENPTAAIFTTEKDSKRLLKADFLSNELKRRLFYIPIEVKIVPQKLSNEFISTITKMVMALALMAAPLISSGQDITRKSIEERFCDYTNLLSPEKLYIHTDRDIYNSGDTIFFKGYLNNSSKLSEYAESNYIYVELISSMVEKEYNTNTDREKERVRARVKIKRMAGSFSGYIKIPESLNTGVAVLRGYSYWMMNREPEYMFYKNIEIRNVIKDDFVKSLVESGIKESAKYTEVGEANPFFQKEAKKADISVAFMPESGRYLLNRQSNIAYKAINENGIGEKIYGSIYLGDSELAKFESDDYGMGTISLSVPFINSDLVAKVSDRRGIEREFTFPAPSPEAAVINLTPDTCGVTIQVSSMGINPKDSLFIIAYDATELFFKHPFEKSQIKLRFKYSELNQGINNIAIANGNGEIFANRTFFAYPTGRVTGSIATNKTSYAKREKAICTIDLNDNVTGDFSLSITDDFYAPQNAENDDIVSYMLFSSELEGHIENPQRFFSDTTPLRERIRDIDLVMLTNGWKYYDIEKILAEKNDMPVLGREYTQSISGRVYGLLGNSKKSIVTFIAPSINFSAIGQLDTSGWFVLDGLDFPDSTKFIVGAVGLNGTAKRFNPILDDEIFAAIHKYPIYTAIRPYDKNYREKFLYNYYNNGGDLFYSIAPLYIVGHNTKRNENISPLPMYTFKDGSYRDEKELEPYSNYDLKTYIVSTCPPLRFETDEVTGEQKILCKTQKVSGRMEISSGWEEIGVYINGMLADCASLEGMTVADIDGFAYIKGAEAAKFDINYTGGTPRSIIMVKSKMYNRNYNAPNVTKGTPMGWQKPIAKYSPQYTIDGTTAKKEAIRETLLWEPFVSVENGKATVEFFTSDNASSYTIQLEGLTSEKRPVHIKHTIMKNPR